MDFLNWFDLIAILIWISVVGVLVPDWWAEWKKERGK